MWLESKEIRRNPITKSQERATFEGLFNLYEMRQIPLSGKLGNGLFALVDDEDFEFLNQWKWHAFKRKYTHYVVRKDSGKGHNRDKVPVIWMHRVILGLQFDNPLMGDHKNMNGLDNQKINLRIATRSQNTINRPRVYTGSSKYKGISWCKSRKKWIAEIKTIDKRIYLGAFDIEEDAARTYDEACIKYHGEFCELHLNFQK